MFRPVIALAASALILAAWGCQSTPTPPPDNAPVDVAEGGTAADLLDQARAASGARQARLYLAASEALFADGNVSAAEAALAYVDTARLRPRETARFLLLDAKLALARNDAEQAAAALLALDDSLLDDPLQAATLTAGLMSAGGRSADAATYLMGYGAGDDAEQQRLNDAIWQYLSDVPPFEVLDQQSRTRGPARGWWQLKTQMLESFTLSEQRRRLDAWLRGNPGHPASRVVPTALMVLLEPPTRVGRVGLAVPLSGSLSRAGRSVRDAFVATYLAHRDEVGFEILIYDTAAESMGSLYERALRDGVEVLIGPLAKETVAQLNSLNPEIPVLALNYLEDDVAAAANLLQLGLAIEDEATSLGEWLRDAGARRVLALYNREDWSARAARALRAATADAELTLQMLEDIRTVTESVGVAMHVAASQERRDELQELLGLPLEFLPRARGDVDAIVALVTPLEAGALVPALRFHFADRIPVYATSQTVRGVATGQLRDFAGFHVSELPWFVMSDVSYQRLDAAFGLQDSPFASLYALGIDAFRLADRAQLIIDGHMTELLGATGELRFSSSGRIQRRLARATIKPDGSLDTSG